MARPSPKIVAPSRTAFTSALALELSLVKARLALEVARSTLVTTLAVREDAPALVMTLSLFAEVLSPKSAKRTPAISTSTPVELEVKLKFSSVVALVLCAFRNQIAIPFVASPTASALAMVNSVPINSPTVADTLPTVL